ncbi:MAG: hypothetical protein IPO15_01605 [Anaerolineae bacterium]|nr:hypothetical protein [Anaerolineae bacterium]
MRRGALIGANVTLLPNIEVGAEAFVAAGSIVTRHVPPATVVMGSPAKSVRERQRRRVRGRTIVTGRTP